MESKGSINKGIPNLIKIKDIITENVKNMSILVWYESAING